MSYFISFAGKGGTGKSSLASLTVRYLLEKKSGPILVIDADPNFCLPELLGVKVQETLASIKDTTLQNKPEGFSLDEWLELQVNRILKESKGFDLLVMGRPEGSGCYCAVNNVLKRVIQEIAEQYKYIVIDNEAGMEHISRGIINKIDLLFIVCTPQKISIKAAYRIDELVRELNIKPKNKILIINQSFNEVEEKLEFDRIYYVYFDHIIKNISEKGESILSLDSNSEILRGFYRVLDEEIE